MKAHLLVALLALAAPAAALNLQDLGHVGVTDAVFPTTWVQGINHTTGAVDSNWTIHAPQTLNTTSSQSYLQVKGSAQGSGTLVFRADVDPAPDEDLAGWWRFDELTGTTALDSSGNGNTGTLNGGVTLDAEGQVGSAFDFDGVDDRVEVADDASLDMTDDLTISAWVYADAFDHANANGFARVLSKTGEYELYVTESAGNLLTFNANGGAPQSGSVGLTTGEWSHVSVTWSEDAGELSFYVNGQLDVVRTAQAYSLVPGGSSLFIGDHPTIVRHWDGAIDDVKILSRAWSPEEVAADYARGLAYMQARCEVPLYGAGVVAPINVHCPSPPFAHGEVLRLQAESLSGSPNWTASYSWQQTDVQTSVIQHHAELIDHRNSTLEVNRLDFGTLDFGAFSVLLLMLTILAIALWQGWMLLGVGATLGSLTTFLDFGSSFTFTGAILLIILFAWLQYWSETKALRRQQS